MSISDSKNRLNKISEKLEKPKDNIVIVVDWSNEGDKRKPEPGEILIYWGKNDNIMTVVGEKKNESNNT